MLYNTTSDRRLKTNINRIENAMNLVDQIDAYTFEYKTNPGTEHMGFIAQELYGVIPSIVKGTPETTNEENPMMVDYSKLTPILLAAVKELKAQNEELAQQVEALTQQNKQMQSIETKVSGLQTQIDQLLSNEE